MDFHSRFFLIQRVRVNDAPAPRSESGTVDLDLAEGALDADAGSCCVEAVGIRGDAQVCEGYAVGAVLRAVGGADGSGAGSGGEGEDHGGHFVGAGGVVGGYC